MAEGENLSADAQDAYVNLGTRNHKTIKKIKTRRLINAIRESQFVGYDKTPPYNWLMFEYDRRKTQRNWILGVVAAILAGAGVLITAFAST
ncbi:hypothetical protein [Halomonas sp. PR-M31]|uniref:hypothetical protein n=1 Tax=Halomonas sp. PR-M31 TaxID=1471202 RepID=UPI00065134B2|nr:hypothetical protein [Halomonas sp. PR-M31]